MRGFAGRQLSALDPLRDAVLLVLGAFANFGFRIGVLHSAIVLVAVDVAGKPVLLAREAGFICRC